MNKKTECRSFEFEVRAENNEQHGNFITGVPIVFEKATERGYFIEVVDSHALDEADLRDVRFLVNHNTDMIPLARSRNNNANSTMQMEVADDGMHIRVDLDTENNAEARSLYSAVKRGDISGMSFMFTIESEEWSGLGTEMPTRRITQIGQVFEVSACTFPQYQQTSVEAASASKALESAKAALESAKDKERRCADLKAEILAKLKGGA